MEGLARDDQVGVPRIGEAVAVELDQLVAGVEKADDEGAAD